MSLLKKTPSPFGSLLTDFFDDRFFERDFFGGKFGKSMPPVNVKDTDDAFELEVVALGFNREDIEISVIDKVMTITGKHKEESEEKKDDYARKEFSFNSFERSFTLPEAVKGDHIEARLDNGILKITVPKAALKKAKTKKKVIDIA